MHVNSTVRAFGLVVILLGCGPNNPQVAAPTVQPVTAPVTFALVDQAGHEVSSSSLRGRVTIGALVTTYDLASQLVLRRVNQALGSYSPRINAFAIVLEAPSYAVLIEAFSDSLDLHFPIVMADQASLDGGGPLGPIDYVPTLVFLDPEGRIVERLRGPVSPEQILTVLDRISRPGPGEIPQP